MIAGGLGGLGRWIARWMIDHGATSILLISRTDAHSEETKRFIQEMQKSGINIATHLSDISDEHSFASMLRNLKAYCHPSKAVSRQRWFCRFDSKIPSDKAGLLTEFGTRCSRVCRQRVSGRQLNRKLTGHGIRTKSYHAVWISSYFCHRQPESSDTVGKPTMRLATPTRML